MIRNQQKQMWNEIAKFLKVFEIIDLLSERLTTMSTSLGPN